jgi:hypothetical protein
MRKLGLIVQLSALAISFVLAIGGCSRGPNYENATVMGTVTIDGQPVPKGFVTFMPSAKNQGPVIGGKIVDGKYCCEKVPLGKSQVIFIAQAVEMTTIVEKATGAKHEVPKNILPPQYAPGLEADVKSGTNNLDFPLRSKK